MKPSLALLTAAVLAVADLHGADADKRAHAPTALPVTATSARSQALAKPSAGERIVFIGNGLAERDVYFSRLETELHLRYPELNLIVRNMGRPGDTAGFRPHRAAFRSGPFPARKNSIPT